MLVRTSDLRPRETISSEFGSEQTTSFARNDMGTIAAWWDVAIQRNQYGIDIVPYMFYERISGRISWKNAMNQGFLAGHNHRLTAAGDPAGISCDAVDGPSIGPIRFLKKTEFGFDLRSVEELNAILGWTLGHRVDCESLTPGLRTIARALNRGEIARAMIATQFLHLRPLDERQALRAAIAIAMVKAAVDDPKHPGWPAGAPGGRGGKFRPTNSSLEDLDELQIPELPDSRQQILTELDRKLVRVAIRTALRRLLTFRRIVRLLGEAASNVVPGLDAIGDAAMVYDIAEMAGDMMELRRLAVAARAWVQHGPYSLIELRVSSQSLSFRSFNEFKKGALEKYFSAAGNGYEYHHIIPQASSLPSEMLNSTENIIRLPRLIHQMVSDEWTKLAREDGKTLRDYLKSMPYAEQRRIGLKILRELGILK